MNRRHVVFAVGSLILATETLRAQKVPFVKDVVRRINTEPGKRSGENRSFPGSRMTRSSRQPRRRMRSGWRLRSIATRS